eukprot:COSAG04_NODE_1513_length_6480_cov_12.776866_1_plen_151_part_00
MDAGSHTQRLVVPSGAGAARYWFLQMDLPLGDAAQATVADIRAEGPTRTRDHSSVCDMQSRCAGDRRDVCETACPDYVGPACLVQCALDPTSSRNFGGSPLTCDASVGGCTLRLVDGPPNVEPEGYTLAPNQGRLEVFYEGQWGTVCDDT